MIATPLITKIKEQGGTLYTFTSTSKDMTKVGTNGNSLQMRFSNFVCLKLPYITKGTFSSSVEENGMYLESIEGYKMTDKNTNGNYKDFNLMIAEHFQNYILNFEALLLNQTTFDESIMRSPAERVFFNWLQKIGCISFVKSDKKDRDGHTLYVEKTGDKYDKVIQYIGKIDAINQVDVNGDSFGEVYMYIPGNAGMSDKVYLRTINDDNYRWDNYICNSELIQGRKENNQTELPISGLGIEALYDVDINGVNYYSGDEGFCIDFRDDSYPDGSIDIMNTNSHKNFEFNCILIYYDLIDTSTGVTKYATNLYGVLFIDNFNDESTDKDDYLAHIEMYPKIASIQTGSEFVEGNAFALKLDLKVDTAPTSTLISRYVGGDATNMYDDPNLVNNWILYEKALERLQKCADIFYTQQHEIYRLQDRIDKLESILTSIADMKYIQSEFDVINSRLDSFNLTDEESMWNLINTNSERLNNLISGKYPTKLALDKSKLNLLFGLGYVGDDSNDVISIKNTLQKYGTITILTDSDSTDGTYSLQLGEGTNLVVIEGVSGKSTQVVMNIDATGAPGGGITWNTGQTMSFVFKEMNSFKDMNSVKEFVINIKFDTKGEYKYIGKVENDRDGNDEDDELQNIKNEIELICTNSVDNEFVIIKR